MAETAEETPPAGPDGPPEGGEGPGPPAPRDLDAFTDRLEHPLAVVTTSSPDGERAGCLVGFLTQCSIDPLRFVVCISKENHTFSVISRAGVLAVHLLGADQTDLASLFGESTGDRVDKFARCGWHTGPLGVPLLDECAAWQVVRILLRVDAGDHMMLVTAPVTGGAGSRSDVLTERDAGPLEAGHPAD
jgi:flavin reductase (DIM6/NTAB) family NADH-FMN oxidoreductase RutF